MAARTKPELPLTQIHLDFHTSEQVPDVGSEFDSEEFAETFARAHVGQVTVFGKCHHGWSYYPTKVGRVHPGLGFDLMGAQIEALHGRRIRAPVYISVGFDEAAWRADPALAAQGREGPWGAKPLEAGWHLLCLGAEPYLATVEAQAREVLARYPADGLFFDILQAPQPGCFCPRCRERMRREGVDLRDDAAVAAWQHVRIRETNARLAAVAKRSRRRGLSVFFNSCFDLRARDLVPSDTHIDVESLPTGGWGYMHFPLVGRFARTFGKPWVGMTARFHHHWGDFGGLKPQAALEQECFHALALGAAVNVGDHLHPRGRPEAAVYERIGRVFGQVAACEPWCRGAKPVTEAAVLAAPEPGHGVRYLPASVAGAVRMLAESHVLFDVVDAGANFAKYAVLILPDTVRLGGALAAKVRGYLAGGGRVLATARAGMAAGENRFALASWPVTYAGEARHTEPFLVVGREIGVGIPDMPHAIYKPGPEVKAKRGARVLARLGDPYFSRSWEHFFGHEEAPMARRTRRPAVVEKGRVAYAQAPLFAAYAESAYPVYRQVMANVLDRLLPERAVDVVMPTTGRVTMLRQGRRRVVHLLAYVAERRTETMDIIEDRVRLTDVALGVALPRKPRAVYLAPQEAPLAFEWAGGRARVRVPVVDGHQMVVMEA